MGTSGRQLLRLNSTSVQVEYVPLTLPLLRRHLDRKIPIIVLVETIFLDYWEADFAHAVVIIGYEDNFLWINDPAFKLAPKRASLDGFLAAWSEFDYLSGIITLRE